jgi:hypothetical protein
MELDLIPEVEVPAPAPAPAASEYEGLESEQEANPTLAPADSGGDSEAGIPPPPSDSGSDSAESVPAAPPPPPPADISPPAPPPPDETEPPSIDDYGASSSADGGGGATSEAVIQVHFLHHFNPTSTFSLHSPKIPTTAALLRMKRGQHRQPNCQRHSSKKRWRRAPAAAEPNRRRCPRLANWPTTMTRRMGPGERRRLHPPARPLATFSSRMKRRKRRASAARIPN